MFVLPINRDDPPARSPVITCSLVVVNAFVWLGLTAAGANHDVVNVYGLHPAHWTALTLFTHMFLHGGFWHVAGNMFFLWMFAPRLEERLGRVFFLLAYFACGLGAAALETLFSPGSMIPMVGPRAQSPEWQGCISSFSPDRHLNSSSIWAGGG